MSEVTRILNAIEGGNPKAADELLPLVYEELRLLAARKMAQERPGHTLQATALVHEAYLRLVDDGASNWNSRGHFFGAAAEAMRRILVEKARQKRSPKHGGDRKRVDVTAGDIAVELPSDDLIALDEALTKLTEEERVVADLVKLRYFAGLPLQQAAGVLGISERTAARYWAYGRVWLLRELTETDQLHQQ
jgi:RNA polymerase sigma factor (TIGR02999 family)